MRQHQALADKGMSWAIVKVSGMKSELNVASIPADAGVGCCFTAGDLKGLGET